MACKNATIEQLNVFCLSDGLVRKHARQKVYEFRAMAIQHMMLVWLFTFVFNGIVGLVYLMQSILCGSLMVVRLVGRVNLASRYFNTEAG